MNDNILDIDFDVENLSKEELSEALEITFKNLITVNKEIFSAKRFGSNVNELEKKKKQLNRVLYKMRLKMFYLKDSC